MQINLRQLFCMGFDHHTLAVELREQLNYPPARVRELMRELDYAAEGAPGELSELALVATCHRWELYGYAAMADSRLPTRLLQRIAGVHGLSAEMLAQGARYLTGSAAAEHLMRVACGLESRVLGEAQVLGQVADAFQQAEKGHTSGPVLRALFQSALAAGKRARSETSIGSQAASISSVALAKAQEESGDLGERAILIVGLGEMARLALAALQARRLRNVGLVNRTLARAQAAAEPWGYRVWPWEELAEALVWADVVYVATAASRPILTLPLLRAVMARRPERSLVLVDAGVPRDVEAGVASLAGVCLFDIDDLRETLDENLKTRRQAVPAVERIIAEELEALRARLDELSVRPLICDLHQKAEAIRARELERTLKHLGDVDPTIISHIQHLSTSLVNKLLHEPTIRLRQKASQGQAEPYITTVRDLFGLEIHST
ncbi:MAG: glutamyl-tRNA reductase [Caldilineae bacterium]|nr:MAG: glutamyl-tRNA reductase [Caldilineae bacterium]